MNTMLNKLVEYFQKRGKYETIQYLDYPEITIKYDVSGIEAPFEYPYIIMGTCNKIDYMSQRFRGWPTEFQIDRFRYHCIYKYEKSGKSEVIDYEDCDEYKEYEG